ncbi:MAG: putative sulfate exporter family transporter [Bacteroidia bacterium]|nr:putative sulfate exporter family transporter [Bacteroidia bacterium]
MKLLYRYSFLPFSWPKALFIIMAFLCFTPWVSSPIALVAGFLFAHFVGHPFEWLKGKAVSNLLKIAVVGLGFGMNAHEALATSQSGFLMIVGSISLTLLMGFLISRLIGIEKVPSYLISVGTAICGGSAIAAVSPVVNAKEQDISMALGVVFLLNAVALILFPFIGHLLDLSQQDFGLWSAIAIHDTSSVVGAANAYGLEALEIATTVKLSRALWIIPVSLFSMLIFRGKGQSVKIPWFILYFVLAMLVNTFFPISFSEDIVGIARSVMVLCLFLIGMGISVEKIRSAGIKPLLHGFSLWVLVSVGSLLMILL